MCAFPARPVFRQRDNSGMAHWRERTMAYAHHAPSDRPVAVGGFDLARRAPKPLRRALPAGTVLTIRGLSPGAALAALGGETWTHDRRAGYGVALAGHEMEHR